TAVPLAAIAPPRPRPRGLVGLGVGLDGGGVAARLVLLVLVRVVAPGVVVLRRNGAAYVLNPHTGVLTACEVQDVVAATHVERDVEVPTGRLPVLKRGVHVEHLVRAARGGSGTLPLHDPAVGR